MLSATKVKMHGISDERWQTRNKITQYKGIVKLFERDVDILQQDFNANKKILNSNLMEIKKHIGENRKKLHKLAIGDEQEVKNMLALHKDLKMALGELNPSIVEEHLVHKNFLLRKERDRLQYSIGKRAERMKNAKLTLAELEDHEHILLNKTTMQLQVESGKIQDMILRQDAAIAVGLTYNNILSIMKKDSNYTNCVLQTLESDCIRQSDCVRLTIELGQNATEYLDDRRSELYILNKSVKDKRTKMLKDLKDVESMIVNLKKKCKNVLRKDQDINVGMENLQKTCKRDFADVIGTISELEDVLQTFSNIVAVTKFENILPCLLAQENNGKNLKTLIKRMEKQKTNLRNKVNYTALVLERSIFTMIDHTKKYQDHRDEIKREIRKNEQELQTIYVKTQKKTEVLLKIDAALRGLLDTCSPIELPSKTRKGLTRFSKEDDLQVTLPVQTNQEVEEIVRVLKRKLSKLITVTSSEMTDVPQFVLYDTYGRLIERYTYQQHESIEETGYDSILDDFTMVDPNIPTRVSIKADSARIIEENKVDPVLRELMKTVKKKKR